MDDSSEIEYRYVKGKGWVAGYKKDGRTLPPITISYDRIFERIARMQPLQIIRGPRGLQPIQIIRGPRGR